MARRIGSKDKKKRKSPLRKYLPGATMIGVAGLGGLALLNKKRLGKLLPKKSVKDLPTEYVEVPLTPGAKRLTNEEVLKKQQEQAVKQVNEALDNIRYKGKSERYKRRKKAYLAARSNPGSEVREDLYITRNKNKNFNKQQRKAAVKRVKSYFDSLKQSGQYSHHLATLATFSNLK